MVQYLRHIITVLVLLAVVKAHADKVWVENFVISAGETKTVELLLDNKITYQSLQCDFELPEGLSIVKNSSNQPVFTATERTADHMIRGSQPSGTGPNHYRVAMITFGKPITGNSGAVATFQVVAADGFTGHHVIEMSNIRVGDEAQVSYKLEDYQCHVTTPITLAELVETGIEGVRYRLSDVLTGVYMPNGATIFAKDDNGFARQGEVPYVVAAGQTQYDNPNAFDQSNWIRINLPASTVTEYAGHEVSGIEGVLVNKLNPEIDVKEEPIVGDESPYEANWYCPANFIKQADYFLMPPKPQEFARIRWAVYHEGAFYVPQKTETNNTFDLCGAVKANFDAFYTGDPLIDGAVYELTAIIRAIDNTQPVPKNVMPKITDLSTQFEICPITAITNHIITSVEDLKTDGRQDGLYYNLLGQPVSHPSSGIYIHNGKKVIIK